MQNPQKKPDPKATPESHQPRELPEIMRLTAQAQAEEAQPPGASPRGASSGGSGIVPVIRPLIHDNYGENYWFNGCAAYAMESLGEPDYDYWFFAGLTGDNFTQIYMRDPTRYRAYAVSDVLMGPDYAKWVFDQVGYACEYVTEQELLAGKEHYLQKLMGSIDRGVPVISRPWGVFVGYEDGGKTLLYITHEMEEPERFAVSGERFIEEREFQYTDDGRTMTFDRIDLIFMGEKQRDVPLARLYLEAVQRWSALLTTRTDEYVFGAQAFRAWSNDIEGGKFDDPATLSEVGFLPQDRGDFEWWNYVNYVCLLATNGSCCFSFLEKAKELNPDMAFLDEIAALYRKMGGMWGGDKPSKGCLEKLGGGFNVTWETLQNPKKRAKIVAKIRRCADCVDEVVRILEQGVQSHGPQELPEIMRLAQRAQDAPQPKGLAENVLRGIPQMRYGDPSAVCYIGSVLRLMEALGDPIAEDELFALSGAGLCFPWQYRSCCDEISIIPEIPRRTFAALGYESEYYYEPDLYAGARTYSKAFYAEKIKRSIDNGRPVLGFGFTKLNFTCLVTGYYHGGDGLYMRAFWSPEGKPEGYDEAMYYSVDDWYDKCHGIVVVGEKTGERLAGEKAYAHLKESAAVFSAMASVTAQGQTIHMGFGAFDAMIAWLLDDSRWDDLHDCGVYLKPCGVLLLRHYRDHLGLYLEKLSEQCAGLVHPAIRPAIARMDELVKGAERSDWDLRRSVDRSITSFSEMEKRENREKVAACVARLKAIDREIFDCLIK